jgi:peptidoglycan biosynthesis protein MviN/MurJ (putative lipid II flippase)
MARLALGGIASVVALNLLLRTFVRLGGPLTTLVIAAAVATAMALWFNWRHARRPEPSEGWQLVILYGGGLGLLYLGLLGMMLIKDDPSPMGLLLLAVHYACYPLCAWVAFVRRF